MWRKSQVTEFELRYMAEEAHLILGTGSPQYLLYKVFDTARVLTELDFIDPILSLRPALHISFLLKGFKSNVCLTPHRRAFLP